MRARCIILTSILFLALTSCDEFRYEITMRRTSDGAVLRTVRYSVHENGHVAAKSVAAPAHLMEIYESQVSGDATEHTYSRSFRAVLPVDMPIGAVSNFGTIASSKSPLGSVHVYRERMPGQTRPWRTFLAIEKVVDTTISAWLAYAGQIPELCEMPDKLDALERLLRGPVRDDSLDLALTVWQAYIGLGQRRKDSDEAEAGHALMQRATLFLQERGYLSSSADVIGADERIGAAAFAALLQRIHLELGGIPDEPLAPALERLLDSDAMGQAFEQGLCLIGLSQNDYSRIATDGLDTGANGNVLTATIRWEGEPRPTATNGDWNSDGGELIWKSGAAAAGMQPDLLFAIWVLPDEAAQQRSLGSVILHDQLPDYNDWYQALAPASRAEWDAYLSARTPDADLTPHLRKWISDHRQLDVWTSPQRDLQRGALILLESLNDAQPK